MVQPQKTIKLDVKTYDKLSELGRKEERSRVALVRRFVRMYEEGELK